MFRLRLRKQLSNMGYELISGLYGVGGAFG